MKNLWFFEEDTLSKVYLIDNGKDKLVIAQKKIKKLLKSLVANIPQNAIDHTTYALTKKLKFSFRINCTLKFSLKSFQSEAFFYIILMYI
jgi:hypothetical protein